MTQSEFEVLINDATKTIPDDIDWSEDEDHSPSVEFRAEIQSETGYPLFVRASYNGSANALTYAIIHRGVGRIYGLDLGKDHHNPQCNNVGEKHKHRWNEILKDKEAYAPTDITAHVNDPLGVWKEFCAEANITHGGTLKAPPPVQLDLL